jgi:hypothetical protein
VGSIPMHLRHSLSMDCGISLTGLLSSVLLRIIINGGESLPIISSAPEISLAVDSSTERR